MAGSPQRRSSRQSSSLLRSAPAQCRFFPVRECVNAQWASVRRVSVAEAWILDVVRTPRGKGRADGGLHGIHPQALLAQCLGALSARIGFEPVDVDDVIAGNGILAADHGDDIARLSLLLAGWPETVPGMTLNRFCGSGQQAITVAAMGVASGVQDLVVAGGVESMSRWNLTAGSVTIDGANPAFRQLYPTVPQDVSADLIATLEAFTREDVDAFAVESQRRAAAAVSSDCSRPCRPSTVQCAFPVCRPGFRAPLAGWPGLRPSWAPTRPRC
ncbi:MAG: acetyl-CoA C-acetyltransferase [Mycobacterium sp.]|nr:acetyl-CoA C-acetyltransferase [Mycobacterium sp.]